MPSNYLGVGPVANEQRDDVGMAAVGRPVEGRVAAVLRAVDPVKGSQPTKPAHLVDIHLREAALLCEVKY